MIFYDNKFTQNIVSILNKNDRWQYCFNRAISTPTCFGKFRTEFITFMCVPYLYCSSPDVELRSNGFGLNGDLPRVHKQMHRQRPQTACKYNFFYCVLNVLYNIDLTIYDMFNDSYVLTIVWGTARVDQYACYKCTLLNYIINAHVSCVLNID